ncbi:MAG: hypothetical protein KGK03_09280 [Candidatus Omnitrophica bacterium]|nr:hypothetical protein [Candidatus Omnitrophota bacterium]
MKKFIWRVYTCIFFLLAVNDASGIFDTQSSLNVYYHTAIILNSWFFLPFVLNVLNVLIECLVGILIFAYVFDVKDTPRLAPELFYIRLLTDLSGHAYSFEIIKSDFVQERLLGLVGLAILIMPVLPSYFIQWRMTFSHKKAP